MLRAADAVLELLSRRKIWVRLLVGAAVLLAIAYIRHAMLAPVDHDEVEHLHVGFKIASGQKPYRDFYQNHWPAYWILSTQFVRAFPYSVQGILAGRITSLLALAGCWLLGLRLLRSFRGGRTWLALAAYTCTLIILAAKMKFYEARPDPVMVLFGAAALCLIPMRGNISGTRAMLLGLLSGLSASVSTKMLPMALVVPALILLICIRDRRMRPALAMISYGLGMLLSLLPTAGWILGHGLFEAFIFDVFDLNSVLSKPWFLSFKFLHIPVYIASALGVAALFGSYGRRLNRSANGSLMLALALVAGVALAFFARHTSQYNLQMLIIPLSTGFSALLISLCLRLREKTCQLLLCAALLGYPIIDISTPLTFLWRNPDALALNEMQAIMDMAKPGNRTCTAFSPAHPVFCRDISGLSNGWDLLFPEQLRDAKQLDRFRKLWHEGIRNTIEQPPDILLRRDPDNIWERAAGDGLITHEELSALEALRPAYEVRAIGRRELWVRRTGVTATGLDHP